MGEFVVSFAVRQEKLLCKPSSCRRFLTPWCACSVIIMTLLQMVRNTWFVWNALRCVCFSPNVCIGGASARRPVGSNTWGTLKSFHSSVTVQIQSTSRCLVRKNKPYAITQNELALMLFYLYTREFCNEWGQLTLYKSSCNGYIIFFIIIELANSNMEIVQINTQVYIEMKNIHLLFHFLYKLLSKTHTHTHKTLQMDL